MATERYFACLCCKRENPASPRLFELLKAVFRRELERCECGGNQFLKLIFNFGFDAAPWPCKILDAFLPREANQWPDGSGGTVTFYPFLVITEGIEDRDRGVWLPYWHIHESGSVKRFKYGQWAPHMGDNTFNDLLTQAREAGFL